MFINTQQTYINKPTFTAINIKNAEETLLNILSDNELKLFYELEKGQSRNKTDILIFSEGNKLSANIYKTKPYDNNVITMAQRFWENPLKFIQRCCQRADKIEGNRPNNYENISKITRK